jgi:hypothetical protein
MKCDACSLDFHPRDIITLHQSTPMGMVEHRGCLKCAAKRVGLQSTSTRDEILNKWQKDNQANHQAG